MVTATPRVYVSGTPEGFTTCRRPAAFERTIAYACMQMLPREHASLLLHAAGILGRGKGLVVSGHSGAGKTPPELARRANRAAPADALLLLAHAPDFELAKLSPSVAVMELLRTDIAAVEPLASAEAWMAAVERLVQAVPVYRLRFRPTSELWDFLAVALDGA